MDELIDQLEDALEELGIPCSGYPSDQGMLERLFTALDVVHDDPKVKMIYVGRSNDPDRRIREHGAHFGFTLYKTESDRHALEIENALVSYSLEHHKKNDNKTDGGGGAVDSTSWHFIYVMVWV